MAGLSFTIDVENSADTPLLRLGDAIQRGDVRKVMGRAVAGELREHFTELDRTHPNEMGGKRTHFWGQVRRSVQQPELIGGDGVKIAINHVGVAQRLFGGHIVPEEPWGWLTIPARSEAYGHRAEEFDDLHFVFFRRNLAALVQNEQVSLGGRVHGSITPGKRKKKETLGGGIFYWLKREILQEPDPSVLPTEAEMGRTAATAGEEYLQQLGGGAA